MLRRLWQLLRDFEMAMAIVIFAVLLAAALAGPFVWRQDPLAIDIVNSLASPSFEHPMGTDAIGRDVLARFNQAALVSMSVGVVVTLISTVLGALIGIPSGLVGGWLDTVLSRVMDAVLAFPPLIFAIAVAIGLGAGITSAIIGIVITAIPWYARLLRGETLRVRQLVFVEAAEALGVGLPSIMWRHVMPQLLSTTFIQMAAVFAYSIMTMAALGFVGLGAQPPTPEWGAMITEGMEYMLTGQWWLSVFPGLGVLLAAVAANLLADRLRDLYDPKSIASIRAM